MNAVARVLTGGKINAQHIPEIEQDTFISIKNPLKRYSSFFLCITLAAVIATCGIAAESTPIIIGAMLVAPLRAPMVGTSFAITRGKPHAALKTLAITASGSLVIIIVAVLVSLIIPTGINLLGNAEIASRVEPRIIDLIVAISAGLLGALAIARDDIADVIPGVAISVSIVSPLCVVGIAAGQGEFTLAGGALLLFVVNFFAIQLSGNLLFYLMGFSRRTPKERENKMRSFWYVSAALGTILLAVPLAAASSKAIESAKVENDTRAAIVSWLEDTDFEVASTKITDKKLVIEIAGEGDYPDSNELKNKLADKDISFEKTSIMVMDAYH